MAFGRQFCGKVDGITDEESLTSETVRSSLARRDIHDAWEADYRTDANERFYEHAFEAVALRLGAMDGTPVLDAGCGPGFHSIRLARRGFRVTAVDFSEPILDLARANVSAAGLDEMVSVERQDLVGLTFGDESFDSVLCWGVLMHIPEVENAVSELSRVLTSKGRLVVSETNVNSLESLALRAVNRVWRRSDRDRRRTSAGLETWKATSAGPLLIRQTDIEWLVAAFADHGLRLVERLPEQFSEAYTKVPGALASAVHRFNALWFDHVKNPGLASGNILVFEKR